MSKLLQNKVVIFLGYGTDARLVCLSEVAALWPNGWMDQDAALDPGDVVLSCGSMLKYN